MNKDLRIRIPRKPHPVTEPYWDLVRKHGGSRRAMIDFICGIGGYSDGYHSRAAIEFNIKADRANLDEDHLWKKIASREVDSMVDERMCPEHVTQARHLFHEIYERHRDHLWEWAREGAWEGWSESDAPYETWLGERFEWKFETAGRSGGHLIMTSFEAHSLKCNPEDLHAGMQDKEEWPDAYVRGLFILCVQNSIEITPKKVSEEVEYNAAFLLADFLSAELPERINLYDSRGDLAEAADDILQFILDQKTVHETAAEQRAQEFINICRLAGVPIEDGDTRISVFGSHVVKTGG